MQQPVAKVRMNMCQNASVNVKCQMQSHAPRVVHRFPWTLLASLLKTFWFELYQLIACQISCTLVSRLEPP